MLTTGTSATSLDTTRAEDAEDDEDGRVCDDDDDNSINDGVAQDAAESAGRGEEGNEVGGDEVVVEIVEEKESFAKAALRRVAQRAEVCCCVGVREIDRAREREREREGVEQDMLDKTSSPFYTVIPLSRILSLTLSLSLSHTHTHTHTRTHAHSLA